MSDFRAVAASVQRDWAAAFAAADPARLAALYAPAVQFWGSTADLHTDAAGLLRYFRDLPPGYVDARFGPPHVLPLGPDAFAASGEVVFTRQTGGQAVARAYRMTQVFVRVGAQWRIGVHHASPCPAA